MYMKAITIFVMLSSLLVLPSTASTTQSNELESRVITPALVSVPITTHLLNTPRPFYYAVANKAIFVSGDDASVDIYDTTANSWSISSPNTASRGDVLGVADDYLVFLDKNDASLLHILNANTVSWTTTTLPEGVNRYHQTVGNFVFYSISYTYSLVVYNIANDTWLSFEEEYEMAENIIFPIKYKTYAVFFFRNRRTGYLTAWNTADDLTRTRFDYGGEYRLFPSAAVAGDYLVVAGGVLETTYSADFSIRNPYSGELYSGKMPTARYLLTILYADPLMLFTNGNLTEAFNLETQQWQTIIQLVEISNIRVSTGHKLFMTYNGQNYAVEFDSTSQKWSSISFTGSHVGPVVKLRDLAAFVDSDNIVIFNPSTQQWTKVQLSLSGSQLKDAFVVGDKVVIVSSDDRTVHVTDFAQLAASAPTPTAPVPVPSSPSPSTPSTVPWSPWTMPVSSTPSAVPWSPWTMPVSNAPRTNSPSMTVPSQSPTMQTPINNNAPTPVSSPSSSPVTFTSPLSGSNLDGTSSSSRVSTISIMSALAVFWSSVM